MGAYLVQNFNAFCKLDFLEYVKRVRFFQPKKALIFTSLRIFGHQ